MISTMIYYLLPASAVLFYGVGINKSIPHNDSFQSSALTCVKSICSASAATSVTYLFVNWLLVPAQLSELYPFFATLIFILCTTLTEIFVDIGIRQSPMDFSVPLLSVFLGLGEGVSVGSSVIIACMSILSFYSVIVVFHCVRERVRFHTQEGGLRSYCALLLCLAVIMLAISGLSISWLNLYLDGGAK